MASAILNFEARRDKDGHLAVYALPKGDGGGKYEVAGINERYNKQTADVLVSMIKTGRFQEAEQLATEFIAQETDRAASWTTIAAIESYLRDCVFNRGAGGAAMILQAAVGTHVDGAVGKVTLDAVSAAEGDAPRLLQRLRDEREAYERNVVGRSESSKFWKGLVNRWNNALAFARTFLPNAPSSQPLAAVMPLAAMLPLVSDASGILPALRVGVSGIRVSSWQAFLIGAGFHPGVVDGYFGEATRNATIEFQTKNGLESDGVAGRQTLLKATEQGFELIEEPAGDTSSSNFPPKPSFANLSDTQRAAIFGTYSYVPAPTAKNAEGIRILGSWASDHIDSVPIPQLKKALGGRAPSQIEFHKRAAKQLQALWAAWEEHQLLDRILTFDGSFVPRFIRGSRTNLSNHSFGTAFDINYQWNKLGQRPALVGQKGCVRELVGIANDHGFYWGGHFDRRKDGMHFEVAFLQG